MSVISVNDTKPRRFYDSSGVPQGSVFVGAYALPSLYEIFVVACMHMIHCWVWMLRGLWT